MRHPRRKKDRRRGKFVVRVREARAALTRYRVRVPMDIKQADPKDVRDLLLEGLRSFGLESNVTVGDCEVAASIEVDAGDPSEAKTKAIYWLKRAADRSRRLSFTGAGIGTVTVEER